MFRQNKHGFFFFPSPPRNNRFSRAFVTVASCISFCCNFTGVLSQYRERVSNANQRLCSVCTHTLCRDTATTPGHHPKKTPSREIAVPCSAGWPEAICTPCTALAEFSQPLHRACTACTRSWRCLHGTCTRGSVFTQGLPHTSQ